MVGSTNRRRFLQVSGATLLASGAVPWGATSTARARVAAQAPSMPVSIAQCTQYEAAAILEQLETMMDQIGGIADLIQNKTVNVKVNMVGSTNARFGGKPSTRTYQVNPAVVHAVARLFDKAGARRIRFMESTHQRKPFLEYLKGSGWDLGYLESLETPVIYEDTHNKGSYKDYVEVKVPGGGSLYPAYLLNRAYNDCDVYVSLCKLKNHYTAGVTLGMKNNFGITPNALYGQAEVDENSTSARGMFHSSPFDPAAGIPQPLDPDSPRKASWRVPHHTVDAASMRPIDLVIIDGIESVSGGEGPWVDLKVQEPGLLLAGRNPVCTDAIATVAMGYDPTSAPGTGPFPGQNHLNMAAELGLGTNDPSNIEVVGVPMEEAQHAYNWLPPERFW